MSPPHVIFILHAVASASSASFERHMTVRWLLPSFSLSSPKRLIYYYIDFAAMPVACCGLPR